MKVNIIFLETFFHPLSLKYEVSSHAQIEVSQFLLGATFHTFSGTKIIN